MAHVEASRRRFSVELTTVMAVLAIWTVFIAGKIGGPLTERNISDVGLAVAALGACVACLLTARRHRSRYRWVWLLLGLSAGSWGFGQMVWAYYEVIAGRQVPFPSFADVGYLTAQPLAVAGLLLLPSGSHSLAGRMRMLLDGLLIAASFLLVSWELVLGKVFAARTGHLFVDVISLAYPVGDVVVVTIVAYAVLRTRQSSRRVPTPLLIVGLGLLCMAGADSGFAYLTATNAYTSGNFIDTGWFMGYLLVLLAARTPTALNGLVVNEEPSSPKGMLLPYLAVTLALVTSSIEVLLGDKSGTFVGWNRSMIIALLVGRQILTVRENVSLTKKLEDRLVQLRASQQRFEALVQQSSDVVTLVDPTGVVLYQSESILRHFGCPASDMKGHPVTELFTSEGVTLFEETLARSIEEPETVTIIEVPVRHSSGQLCHAEVAVTNLLSNASVNGIVLNIRDISERKALSDQLVHQAFHDPLTELANRALFREHLEKVVRESDPEVPSAAVLFLDLDGFKKINDSLGHAAGDMLLAQVADRLASCVRPGDIVARLGGDEFGIVIEGVDRYLEAQALAARILSSLNAPFIIDGSEVHVRGSIGIATADHGVENADQLLRNADLAMYRAKTFGGGVVKDYNPDMNTEFLERLEIEADLRRAVGRGEMVLNYQPVLALNTGQTTGFEALIRWNHPSKGVIGPARFIGIAEQTGLIQPIGRWVLHEACRQTVILQGANPKWADLSISVNISARQLQSDDLLEDVANALEESGLAPENLVLEMTESVLVEHSDSNLERLSTLKAMGVRIALDDFGTGYSSLAYLHRFPVDVLKIDRTFISRLHDTPEDHDLVRSILQIGRSLRTATVAEGIETADQCRLLDELGCEFGQGFYLAKPMTAEALTCWLRDSEGSAYRAS